MSSILAGFVRGATGQALDDINERKKQEREIAKARLLAQLQADTQKEMLLFQEHLSAKKPDKYMSTDDLKSGKRTLRNERGEELGQIDLPAHLAEDRALDLRKAELDIANVESTITSRDRDDARQDKMLSLSERRAAGGGTGLGGNVDTFDIADELMYRYRDDVADTVKSNNISKSAIREAALKFAEAKNGQEAQRLFLTFLNRYRTGRKKTDQSMRALDDSF